MKPFMGANPRYPSFGEHETLIPPYMYINQTAGHIHGKTNSSNISEIMGVRFSAIKLYIRPYDGLPLGPPAQHGIANLLNLVP